jgi:alanine-glyoxylate transaminase/serine-glyoxylate transaminase/serine-pyruvate transaminase
MIPGPSDPEPEVLAELSLPVLPHYGDKWMAIYQDTLSMMQKVFETKNEVIIVPTPGHLAVEMAVANLAEKGQDVFICVNGFFAETIVGMAEAVGSNPVTIASPLGRGPTLEEVKATVEARGDPAGKPIFLVQNETSTGAATNPADIFRYCKEKGMLTALDSISAIGAMDVLADDWQVDYAIGYSSKALGGIFGAQPVAIGKDAWEAAARKKGRIGSTFLDLNAWREAIDVDSSWGHPYPTSMPTSAIVALRKALSMALDEGLDNRYRRHAEAARELREGLEALGLEIFTHPGFYSNSVTAPKLDEKLNAELRRRLAKDYDIMIAGGLGPLRGKIVRVGTMGSGARHEKVQTVLSAFGSVLKQIRG